MTLTQMPKVGAKVRHIDGSHVYDISRYDEWGNAVITLPDLGDCGLIMEDDFEEFELISEGADNMTKPITRAEYWADKRREIEGATYTAEQRQARKGERIVIVEPNVHDSEDYERGDIFRVDKVDSAGVTTTTGNIVYHEEYEVLPEDMADGAEKRYAKPGERIVITSPYDDQIACGEEYTVKTTEDDVVITAEDGKAIAHEEYEVLPDGMAIDDEVADSVAMLSEAIREIVDDSDNVHSPQHYRQGGVEVIDIIRDAVRDAGGFEAVCHANVIKYVLRYRYKNGVEDVKKARVYLDWLIAELETKEGR